MSDQPQGATPRPQYGEYATPEEQRARTGRPDGEAVADSGRQGPVAPLVAAPAVTSAAPLGEKRSRGLDRIVTIALLAYGIISVVTSIPALVDYGTYAETMFNVLGIDVHLSDPAAGRPWGIAAALVLVIGWAVTAAISWWSLRRGRVTWWIPIVGAIVFTVASSVLMIVPLMSDQAVWDVIVGTTP